MHLHALAISEILWRVANQVPVFASESLSCSKTAICITFCALDVYFVQADSGRSAESNFPQKFTAIFAAVTRNLGQMAQEQVLVAENGGTFLVASVYRVILRHEGIPRLQ